MNNRLLFLAAAPFLMADGSPQSFRQWSLKAPAVDAPALDVNLVRGNVHREVGSGPVQIAVRIVPNHTPALDVEVRRTPDGWELRDIYPPAPADQIDECLPPQDSRRAFWLSDAVLEVTVSAPANIIVRTHIMEPQLTGTGTRSVIRPDKR